MQIFIISFTMFPSVNTLLAPLSGMLIFIINLTFCPLLIKTGWWRLTITKRSCDEETQKTQKLQEDVKNIVKLNRTILTNSTRLTEK